jgi:hypothetical protein
MDYLCRRQYYDKCAISGHSRQKKVRDNNEEFCPNNMEDGVRKQQQ